MTTVLKLGGSVITEKDEPETIDRGRLESAARALGAADEQLVVVHGAGSFGHHYAAKHGVSVTEGTRDVTAVREVHDAMVRLNQVVVAELAANGIPAIPVQPLSIGARDADGALTLPTAAIERQLSEGFVPVLHGDLVAHEGTGATVLSGDELIVRIATAVGADRVGVCSTVPGVLDEDGTVVDRIEAMADVASVLGESDSTDVTGGMAGKVAALLELDVEAAIFGPEDLDAFVRGNAPGTTVDGR